MDAPRSAKLGPNSGWRGMVTRPEPLVVAENCTRNTQPVESSSCWAQVPASPLDGSPSTPQLSAVSQASSSRPIGSKVSIRGSFGSSIAQE